MWNYLFVEKFVDWMNGKFVSARNYSKSLHWFQMNEPTFIEIVLKKENKKYNGSALFALNRWKIPSLHSCRWRVLFSANASLHYEPERWQFGSQVQRGHNTSMKMPTKITMKRKNNSNKFMWNEWQKKKEEEKVNNKQRFNNVDCNLNLHRERLNDSLRLVSKIMLICEKSSAQSIVRCHLYMVWNISSFENWNRNEIEKNKEEN